VKALRLVQLGVTLLSCWAMSQEQVRKEAKVSPNPLSIRIELQRERAGKVVFTNSGSAAVRIWRMDNSWGDESLSFEASLDGRVEPITLKRQVYTRNVPATVVVSPGGKHDFPFNLDDGKWEPAAVINRLHGSDVQLTAVFRIPESPESVTQGVWTGELRSQPKGLK
jgi:hypothetical protein